MVIEFLFLQKKKSNGYQINSHCIFSEGPLFVVIDDLASSAFLPFVKVKEKSKTLKVENKTKK